MTLSDVGKPRRKIAATIVAMSFCFVVAACAALFLIKPRESSAQKAVDALRERGAKVSINSVHLDLSRLRLKDLDGTALDDAGMKHIANLANLHTLTAEGTVIGDAGIETISHLNLWCLNVRRTRVTAKSLDILLGMKGLKLLHVDDAFFAAEDRRKKTLPSRRQRPSDG